MRIKVIIESGFGIHKPDNKSSCSKIIKDELHAHCLPQMEKRLSVGVLMGQCVSGIWKTGELITTLEDYDPDSPIVFSPDGQTFVSGGENAKVLLWDLNTGRLKTTFTAYNPVRRISFEEDGKTLITSGTDGTTLLWDLKEIDK